MTQYNDLLAYIQKKRLFDKHQKVLVAVSSGIDSMNLLQFLYKHRETLGIELAIAHVNHQQRQESTAEEAYLRQWAKEHDLPIYVSHFEGLFSEKRARDFRYDFFKKCMQKYNYTALTTAHHADDQAETVLMRIIRGSRLRHLVAIKEVQHFAEGELIRPFLTLKKAELPYVVHFEDMSNKSEHYFRNRVRNRYLPLLERENAQLKTALCHLANDSRLAYQAFRDLIASLDITKNAVFLSQSEAVQSLALEEYFSQFSDLELSRRQFDTVLDLLRSHKQLTYSLKNNYILHKDEERFWVDKKEAISFLSSPCLLVSGETLVYDGYRFSYDKEQLSLAIPLYDNSPITLRHRQAGDKISFGHFTKKVRRLFIDDKLSQKEREEAIIGEQKGEIIFILTSRKTYLRKASKHDIMIGKLYYQSVNKGDHMLENDIKKVLYTEEDIIRKTKELGAQLTEDYKDKNPLLVGVLKGSVPFMAELMKHIDTHVEIDFMVVSSYHGGTTSSGEVKILKDVDTNVEGRDIIFIEDIIDTGRTLKYLRDMFKYRQAKSVKIATLFDKPEGRVVEIDADYFCYDVPNEFIVGFGLDYAENYRNLPYVGVLKEEIYSN